MKVRKTGDVRDVCRSMFGGILITAVTFVGHVQCAQAAHDDVDEDVRDRIAMLQPPLGTYNIEVDRKGRKGVRLDGYVDSEQSRRRAQEAAASVKGVSKVDNRLALSTAGTTLKNEEIDRLQQAFRREVPNGRYDLSVRTEPKKVTLRGTVDSRATKDRIIAVAGSVAKRPIVDQLAVTGLRPDAEVQESINRALNEEYPRLMKDLQVSVKDGVASVEGNVARRTDVDKVLATTLMTNGVTDIENKMTVHGQPYMQGLK